ncbi:MAG: Glycine cleavage system H protein [Deltaproteobacteria bacterium ADurb.Bin510]|nr:MAG: Glycine cleavage system H protein [Deltaproteobacteria bacterium ADurb.Bin510]
MNIPEDLKFTKEHEWARLEGNCIRVGITDYAQHELGDVVFVELPAVGSHVEQDDSFGSVESVKAVSDLFAPASGTIKEINTELEDAPENVNEDSYGKGWMVVIELDKPEELDGLMDAEAYAEFVEAEAK